MIYLKTTDGRHIVVLEAGNVDRLRDGQPAVTPNREVMIAYTPDPVWLADQIMGCDGDAAKIAAAIDVGAKRPQKTPDRPTHGTHNLDRRAEQ